jgi:hypothetical protein
VTVFKIVRSVMVGAHATQVTAYEYRAPSEGFTLRVEVRNRPPDVFRNLRFDCLSAFMQRPPVPE